MPDPNGWNASTSAESRANEGRVGDPIGNLSENLKMLEVSLDNEAMQRLSAV